MSADMLSEVQDTVVSGIENNSSPALSIEVFCIWITRMHANP